MGYFDLKRGGGNITSPTEHASTHHAGGTDPISAEAIGAEVAGTASAAIAAHTAQANPHSQYLQEVSWGMIGGIPSTFPPSNHSHPVNAANVTPAIANNSIFELSGLTIGMLFFYARNPAYIQLNGILTYRVSLGSNFMRFILKDATNIATATGIPIGTSGSAGNLTFFGGNNDGKLYIENRTGGNISLGLHAING